MITWLRAVGTIGACLGGDENSGTERSYRNSTMSTMFYFQVLPLRKALSTPGKVRFQWKMPRLYI